ncbi:MAG: mechanosensitive ion channel family protein [Crocosphaera sp.]
MIIKTRKIMSILTIMLLTVLCLLSLHIFMPTAAQINPINPVEIASKKYLFNDDVLAQKQAETDKSDPSKTEESVVDNPPYPVTLDGEILFEYNAQIEGVSNAQRAEEATKRIQEVADDRSISMENLRVINVEGIHLIEVENNLLVSLTKADAEVENKPIDELAQEYLEKVKSAILEYRQERTLYQFGLKALWIFLSTLIVILIFRFLNWFFPRIHRRIIEERSFIFRNISIQNWNVWTIDKEKQFALFVVKIIRWIITLIILYFYIPLLLSLFPQTERLGKSFFSSFFAALGQAWQGFVDYFPNLFVIIITLIITHYLIRLCEPFFKALEEERVTIPGFYPDWAQPTYKLTVILILALAAAIVFPYLPGFNSPAFQGISLLVGALVTFGGASTIANLIGGFVVIYTRAFQIGDRIKIENYRGVVLEKSILSTRICNGENEIITIPNSIMVASTIINYSATVRELQQPLVINTSITLGYDVPWRLVHETLINSALETVDILEDPAPYVWQTSLDDFYVSYELRAYTNKTKSVLIGHIFSQLHQNIQDKCAEVGIEILSPHYAAVRDGHQNTIPENYLPKDYQAPGFRLHPLESFVKQDITKNKSNSETED